MGGHLGCLHVLANVNISAMNIGSENTVRKDTHAPIASVLLFPTKETVTSLVSPELDFVLKMQFLLSFMQIHLNFV